MLLLIREHTNLARLVNIVCFRNQSINQSIITLLPVSSESVILLRAQDFLLGSKYHPSVDETQEWYVIGNSGRRGIITPSSGKAVVCYCRFINPRRLSRKDCYCITTCPAVSAHHFSLSIRCGAAASRLHTAARSLCVGFLAIFNNQSRFNPFKCRAHPT
jgi:hypothetical protein